MYGGFKLGKAIPQTIKDQAMELFIKGDKSAREISEIISTNDYNVKTVTIYAWAKRGKWAERSAVERVNRQQEVMKKDANRYVIAQEEQADSYKKIRIKADKELDSLTFESPGEAVKAVDTAIKGERLVAKGMFDAEFVELIVSIIQDEVSSQEEKNRISELDNTDEKDDDQHIGENID